MSAFVLAWVVLSQTAETASVQGQARHATTGQAVPQANVVLVPAANPNHWEGGFGTVTNATGGFEITGIPPGRYRLRAGRTGFVVREYGARGGRTEGTILDLRKGEELKGLEMRLTPHGVIAGRIVDAAGEPVEHAQVQVLRRRYRDGRKVLKNAGTASTNDLGEYRVAGLEPGSYHVYVLVFEDFRLALPRSAIRREEWVPAYFPGVTRERDAVPVEVTPGQTPRADLTLTKARTVKVKGVVTVEPPGAARLPRIYLSRSEEPVDLGMFRTWPGVVTQSGEFEVRNVLPGSYLAQASVEVAGEMLFGLAPVDVSGDDVGGVVVPVRTPLVLRGKVRAEGDPVNWSRVKVAVRPLAVPLIGAGEDETFKVEADGTFRFAQQLPGVYALRATDLPEDHYVKQVLWSGQDVTVRGVALNVSDREPLEIVIGRGAGRLEGIAQRGEAKEPASGATVVLMPVEEARQRHPWFVAETTSDQHGRFAFPRVSPGEYRLYAWDEVEPGAWFDPEFARHLKDKGTPVTVQENGRVRVEIAVAADQR